MIKGRFVLVSMLFLVLAAGCGAGMHGGTVSGKVTYNNAPVTAGTVVFLPAEGPTYSIPISPEGTYSTTDIPPNEYSVTVETESANKNKLARTYGGARGKAAEKDAQKVVEGDKRGSLTSPAPDGFQAGGGPYVKIPIKYSLPTSSGLKVTITKGNNTHNFPLTD